MDHRMVAHIGHGSHGSCVLLVTWVMGHWVMVTCVMGHVGHGWHGHGYMGHGSHGSCVSWVMWVMGQIGHVCYWSRGSWVTWVMVKCVMGHVGQITNDQLLSVTPTGAALLENNEASAKLTTANGGTFTWAQLDTVANHVTARSIGDWRALTWLAAETGWTRRKCSAICSGKLISVHVIWYDVNRRYGI